MYETARPSRPGRVSYVIVNNYRTNFDDFREVYLLGIQVDKRLTKETCLEGFLNTQSLAGFAIVQ